MKRSFGYLVFCSVLALPLQSLRAADNDPAAPAKPNPIAEISLSVSELGKSNDPREQIVLRSDGTASLIKGEAWLRTPPHGGNGRFTGTVQAQDFEQLLALVDTLQFFALRDTKYAIGYPGADVTIQVTQGKRHKTVITDMFGAPAAAWGMEMAIRGVAAGIPWHEVATPAPAAPAPQPQ